MGSSNDGLPAPLTVVRVCDNIVENSRVEIVQSRIARADSLSACVFTPDHTDLVWQVRVARVE